MERLPDLTLDADRVAWAALAEDGPSDLTTEIALPPPSPRVDALVVLRGSGVVAGLTYADAVARLSGCMAYWSVKEGSVVERGVLGHVGGYLAAILRAERPLLNLLQRAVGIATTTRAFVNAVAGTNCRILHTRKTAPGLRLFDVAAVALGGGEVHRLALAHTVMIKDNHWRAMAAAGRTLRDAVADAQRRGAAKCQVEVESVAQVEEACAAGAERVLVDNQLPDTVRAWADLARRLRPGIAIEATGGVTLQNVRAYADAGADYVSIGSLTHSVAAADIALQLQSGEPG